MPKTNQSDTIRTIVKVAVLGVISFILMFFKTPVWFAPVFLKFDISDMPSLLGAFAVGPATGVWVQLVKNVLNVLSEGTTTGGVGEFSNFLIGSSFALVAGLIYGRRKTFRTALLAMGTGLLAMTLFATLSNYFVMFPLYSKVLGLSIDKLVGMGTKVNKYVVDYKTLMLFAVVPFNLLKGLATALVTVLVYKRTSPVLHR